MMRALRCDTVSTGLSQRTSEQEDDSSRGVVVLTNMEILDPNTAGQKKWMRSQVTECITREIYPHKKFIVKDVEMECLDKRCKSECATS